MVSLRTVEREVAGLRQALRAEVRFETPPGKQLQIDFSETRLSIDGVGVATLGHSRRCFVRRISTSGNRPGSTG
jgi:transposase